MQPEATTGGALPSICFVATGAYGAVSGRPEVRHIGGAEMQQVRIGRELHRRGHRVSFVTLDHGQPDGIEHQGLTVFRMCGWEDGIPGLRFFHPRWTSLLRALGRADANVYYQRGAGPETGQVSLWCRARRRPFVFAAASDSNCVPGLPDLPTRRERVLYRYGLRQATRIVAQTEVQAGLLRDSFGLQSTLIKSCSEDPLGTGEAVPGEARNGRVLWIGRFAPKKRFELLLELASSSPEIGFDIVGGEAASRGYSAKMSEQARRLPNVTLHGWVPPEGVGAFYDRTSLLLCTSWVEGFPNTFMEAWARGTPTVSTVDPDRIIGTHGLGGTGKTAADLRAAIVALRSPETWRGCSQRARRYFLENHTIPAAAGRYQELLRALCASQPQPEETGTFVVKRTG
jgi:glycosyltransferase involved in cell wall biosynthesis